MTMDFGDDHPFHFGVEPGSTPRSLNWHPRMPVCSLGMGVPNLRGRTPPKPTSSVTSLLIGNCGKPAREGCDCGTFPALVTIPTRRRRLPVDGSIILRVARLAPLGPPRRQPRLCRCPLWKGG